MSTESTPPDSRSALPGPLVEFRGYIPELDGLRAIAVLLVFGHHFWPARYLASPLAALSRLGWIGVDLFFVLSGFLITGLLHDQRDSPRYYRSFYIRRALRIFPLYYTALIAVTATMLLVAGGTKFQQMTSAWGTPWWFFVYLGNLRVAVMSAWPTVWFFAPLWSLQVEEQYYLVFPFLVRHCTLRTLERLLWLVIVASPLSRLVLWLLLPGHAEAPYVLLPFRLDGFAWGGLLAIALRRGVVVRSPRVLAAGVGLLVALMGIALARGGYEWATPVNRIVGFSLTSVAGVGVVCWSIARRRRPATAWLRRGPLAAIGRISYGVYLLQSVGVSTAGWLLQTLEWSIDPEGILLALLRLGMTIALAALSFRFLEQPFLRLKSRLAPVS